MYASIAIVPFFIVKNCRRRKSTRVVELRENKLDSAFTLLSMSLDLRLVGESREREQQETILENRKRGQIDRACNSSAPSRTADTKCLPGDVISGFKVTKTNFFTYNAGASSLDAFSMGAVAMTSVFAAETRGESIDDKSLPYRESVES